ncbi:S8 family serine peptidase [Kribbella sp. NBC_00889]|uniref:S8 family serine peptidase n=1 Tax=Kribbella sp. NBC_00889 TaxID=2975974 RepID=UPI003865E0EB|nr:S8 family serine peptidase [Kribbella sp. NBC_00889]
MLPRLLPAVALAGSLALAPVTATGSAATAPTAAHEQSAAVTRTDLVTLVTGDVVRLDTLADGKQQATVVTTTPGSSNAGTHIYLQDGDVYVEPASALDLMAAGKLDRRLFDVSALVRQGYGDNDRSTLPLIVSYRTGATFKAVSQPKDAKTGFLADIQKRPDVEKVWLDARTRPVGTQLTKGTKDSAATKTTSAYDGTGSLIAVLDTGIDASHPDFAGRIALTRDFTGGNDTTDRFGSGTHSASLAAGSGAASDGQYAGAAPGAHLAVGKVFDDTGAGYESWAIAGLQSAVDSGADVIDVNVAGSITRGEDPLTQAVDDLGRESDALFVVPTSSKSYAEPGTTNVVAPGAAPAALTVGGTNRGNWWDQARHGVMADRGAIKPELVAPAFGVIGAYPGGGYASAVSTSASAAYAAGAAAVLHQEHSEWSPGLLKATLASSADPVERSTAFTVGAGAVDLARATAQQVSVDQGVVSFGHITRPYRADQLRQQKTLTYQNHSETAVTLDLATDLAGVTVTPATTTIAAGASADVTLTLDATALEADEYSGRVTATGPGVELATTVGFVKQDDTVDVTIRMLDRNGKPASGRARIAPYQETDGRYYAEELLFSPNQKEWTLRLPEGNYNVFGLITTPDGSGDTTSEISIVGLPKMSAHAPNYTVTLDARTARPMTLTTSKPSAPHSVSVRWNRGDPGDTHAIYDEWATDMTTGTPLRLSMSPTERVTDAGFSVMTTWDSGVPLLQARSGGGRVSASYAGGPLTDGKRRYRLVDADAQPKQVAGAVALVQQPGDRSVDEVVQQLTDAGAVAVAVYPVQNADLVRHLYGPGVVTMALSRSDGLELRSEARSPWTWMELTETPRSPYAYDVSFVEKGQVARDLSYRSSDLATVTTRIYSSGTGEAGAGWVLNQHSDASCGCSTSPVGDWVPTTGYTRTQYVTADRDVKATTAWEFYAKKTLVRPREFPTYRPGEHADLEFLKAPYSPGVAAGARNDSQGTTNRRGDVIDFDYAPFTDAAGNWARSLPGTSVNTTLYADDAEVYNSGFTVGNVPVPATSSRYRLVSDVANNRSVVGLTTNAHTEWTFGSTTVAAGSKVLPLLDVDYTDVTDARPGHTALDLANTARLGQRVSLNLSVGHQPGATAGPIRSLTVEISTDEGATWQPTSIRNLHNGRYQATYTHPHKGQSVSLRIHSTDTDNNAITQTLTNSYNLR